MNTTTKRTMAAYVLDTLANGQGSLQDWELMQVSVSNWMDEETENLQSYRARLEQDEDHRAKGKAYKAKVRLQNFQAARVFLAQLFQQLVNDRIKQQGILKDLVKQDHLCVQYKQWAQEFYASWMQSQAESKLYLKMLLDRSTVPAQFEAYVMDRVRKDVELQKLVTLLMNNGINEL